MTYPVAIPGSGPVMLAASPPSHELFEALISDETDHNSPNNMYMIPS